MQEIALKEDMEITYEPDEPLSLAKMIEYRNKGLSYEEIARILGCTKQNVWERLQPFRQSIDNIKGINDNRANVLSVVSDSILNSLTADDIKKSSGYQKVGMYALLYDKYRLETNQSTANIAYTDMSRRLSELDSEINRLSEELGDTIEQE